MFTAKTFKTALTRYRVIDPTLWKSQAISRELADVFGGEGTTDDSPLYNFIRIISSSGELSNLIDMESEDDFIRIATKISKETSMDAQKVWTMMSIITGAVLNQTFEYDDLIEQEALSNRKRLTDYVIEDNVILNYVGNDDAILIPDTYKKKRIRSIAPRAFMGKGLRSVKIPEGVLDIGENAFANNQLLEVELPNSLTTIGNHAFSENQIKNIKIPERVEVIHEFAFARNEIETIRFAESIKRIYAGAFYNNKIRVLDLPQSVISIGVSAFENNEINDIAFGLNISSIGNYAFRNNKLRHICIPNATNHVGLYAFSKNPLRMLHLSDFTLKFLQENDAYDLYDGIEINYKYSDQICHKQIINEKMCPACNKKM